jgi:3-oxoadipate enol-lactonase
VLVFINGTRQALGYWKSQREALAERYSMLFYDLRGAGRSLPPDRDWTLQDHCQDLQQLIDQELPHSKVILVGHSLGGMIALRYTLQYSSSVSGMVLMNSALNMPFPLERMIRSFLQGFESRDPVLVEFMQDFGLAISYGDRYLRQIAPKMDALRQRMIQAIDYDSVCHLYRGLLKSAEAPVCESLLQGLNMPVLLIAGEEDMQFPESCSRLMMHHLPDARLQSVPECGHFALSEQPQRVNEWILDFLTRCAASLGLQTGEG